MLEKGQIRFQGTVSELTQQVQGKCWLWRTTLEQVQALRQKDTNLVASLSPVTDGNTDEVLARVTGPQPSPAATPVDPTLDDGYFALRGATAFHEEQHFSSR
uniref:Uncharacterized protein n=1 Tax=Thermosporothrix sp. COM3 TaxID=2490863 RepID=A0A455SIV3_9CHLR|nr:hypothetical protein KTC_20490 [Thermosporothrix sp. COM3]